VVGPVIAGNPFTTRFPETFRFVHKAMATVFEIYVVHADTEYAQQAASAAFEELDRIEREISRYLDNSDISRINNLPAHKTLRIGLTSFECLKLCTGLCTDTHGVFDITVGSLVDCWLGKEKSGSSPSEEEINGARQSTGSHLIELDETEHTVQLKHSPVKIDLGGFGKGYAIDRMAAHLRDWSINMALIDGGRSTVLALDRPPWANGWPVTVSDPEQCKETLMFFSLQNQALSGSGIRKGRHIIDPRTARPVNHTLAAWVCASSAATADALSTSFMIMSPEEVRGYWLNHPDTQAVLVRNTDKTDRQETRILCFGVQKEKNL
jgi:thiamine biosynthesis lipoprotein